MFYTQPHQIPVYQLPLPLYESTAAYLEKQIGRMAYDDALVAHRRGYRLEYLYLSYGYPHFRLYKGKTLVGIVDVRTPRQLPEIRKRLAIHLASLGFTSFNTRLRIFGALTEIDATKRGRRLF